MRSKILFLMTGSLLVLATLLMPAAASAHQPYCEYEDLDAESPWQVPDADVSYAYYGNLYPESDVDYFTFEASAGQSVLLSLSIPAIDGQEDFAPILAVFGPGLDMELVEDLPARVSVPEEQGAMFVPLGDEPEYWYEPFGKRYYWNWENYFFEAPEDATYTVALWHPEEELGRYSFVVGEQEIFGGDRECTASFATYWTPLVAGENPYRDATDDEDAHVHAEGKAHDHAEGNAHDEGDGEAHDHAEGEMHDNAEGETHDHGDLLEVSAESAPFVDLQVIPLDDGGYNVRIQTLNFIFAPHHVGMDSVAGEGHAHLYVDGEKIARVYGEWYHLEALSDDAEMISVSLYANNHQPLAVDGEEITDMVMVANVVDAEE